MKNNIEGILLEYDSISNLNIAIDKISKNNYEDWEVYSPFPIHGIEKKMNLKPSKLPWIVFFFALIGAILGIFLILWSSVYELPLNIGGKPLFSIPAFFPVVFEIVILFSAISCVFGLFFLCNLPCYNLNLFNYESFNRVTDDRFFIFLKTSIKNDNFEEFKKISENTKALKILYIES